jgi:hypothetical protein
MAGHSQFMDNDDHGALFENESQNLDFCMDSKGNINLLEDIFVDENGAYYDKQGRRCDENGNLLDSKGNINQEALDMDCENLSQQEKIVNELINMMREQEDGSVDFEDDQN